MQEYERLKQNDLFSTVKRNTFSGNTVAVLVQNVRSLARHADDILSDNRIINTNIMGFTKTQFKPSDSTCKITELSNLFNINFNINENKFSGIASRCGNNVTVLNKFDTNGLSILSFKKHALADRVFTLMLAYRKQSMHMQEYFQMLQYFPATYSKDIIAGEFSYVFLKVPQNKFLDVFIDHDQMVNKPTHISGSLIDHVNIKNALMEKFFTNVGVENIYFLDHDTVIIAIQKKYVDFHITS